METFAIEVIISACTVVFNGVTYEGENAFDSTRRVHPMAEFAAFK